jgi:AraC family transcriptional regulator
MQSAPRLEIVVNGKRETALRTTPEAASLVSHDSGFLMEEHRCRNLEMPDHWVPYYLVALHSVRSPVRRFLFESGRELECVVHDGTCDVVAPHELRRFRSEGESQSVMVSIQPEALQSIIVDSRPRSSIELLRRWHGRDPALSELVMRVSSEAKASSPNGSLFLDSLYMKLAEELVQRYSIGRARLDQYRGGISGARLQRMVDYIEAHLNASLSTGDIARIAGLSKYHCGKAFKQATGMALHSYVLIRRITLARQLLSKPDLSLAQIADATGFATQSHLTTAFLTRTGMTPGLFRRINRPLSFIWRCRITRHSRMRAPPRKPRLPELILGDDSPSRAAIA